MKGAILDMDGVLWRAKTPLCDLPSLFDNFKKNNIKVTLATNNGLKPFVDMWISWPVMVSKLRNGR